MQSNATVGRVLATRYYVRTFCRDGRHFLWGNFATRAGADAARQAADRRRPQLARRTDSYVFAVLCVP